MSDQPTFFFYDLETSGISPRSARIMQFAGQRTDMSLRPVGDPVNVLIQLSPDVLPEPEAVLLTGITPQQTQADGVTEAAFLRQFESEIATPNTIFAGYNSVRFDDEFVRFLRYRNLYDAYDWQWKDGRSRWDLLDVVRMTRALRPEGIAWPFAPSGEPTVRLELLTALNKLDHDNAHDALNDVHATIAVAQLIRDRQPKMFEYLLNLRDKRKVAGLVDGGEPFVYTSGKYPNDYEKTVVAMKIADHPGRQGALVFDLHADPDEYASLSARELAKLWQYNPDPAAPRLPVKTLQYNRCPAVAPLSVLDAGSQERIKLDTKTWRAHAKKLARADGFADRLVAALGLLDQQRQTELVSNEQDVDEQLYDGFYDDHDSRLLGVIRAADPDAITDFANDVHDARLRALLPRYKARNFAAALTSEERAAWETYCARRLLDGGTDSRLANYFKRLEVCATLPQYQAKQFLIEELKLYGESLLPAEFAA